MLLIPLSKAAMAVQPAISLAIVGQVIPRGCLPEQRTANQDQLGRALELGPPYRPALPVVFP